MNYRLLLILLDMASLSLIMGFCGVVFKIEAVNEFKFFAVISVITVFVFFVKKYYFRRMPLWTDIKDSFYGLFFSMLVVMLISTHLKYSYIDIALIYFVLIIFLPCFRFFGKQFLFRMGFGIEKVIIIGADSLGINTLKGFVNEKNLGYIVLGFLDNSYGSAPAPIEYCGKEYKIIGDVNSVHDSKFSGTCSSVVIVETALDRNELDDLICMLQTSFKKIIYVPALKKIAVLNTELYYLFDEELFYIRIKNNLLRRTNKIAKVFFNYVLSVIILVLISPILVGISLIIRFTSTGPIIFAHERVGKNGKPFNCYKFRSMYADAQERLKIILETDAEAKAEWEATYKLKNDPRITKIGNFLRKTSLDELPQIFNVLKGEMCLVGPRPVVQEELDKYYKEDAKYYTMTEPGITGLWQVGGRSDTDYEYRVNLDKWYVLNWSLWLDIVVLFKTINVVLLRKGAY